MDFIEAVKDAVETLKPVQLCYADYIAYRIADTLGAADHQRIIHSVSKVHWDLHPTEGYMLSTKKTVNVVDKNGKSYRVTVEEI